MSKLKSVGLILITRSKYVLRNERSQLKYRALGHKVRIRIEFLANTFVCKIGQKK